MTTYDRHRRCLRLVKKGVTLKFTVSETKLNDSAQFGVLHIEDPLPLKAMKPYCDTTTDDEANHSAIRVVLARHICKYIFFQASTAKLCKFCLLCAMPKVT